MFTMGVLSKTSTSASVRRTEVVRKKPNVSTPSVVSTASARRDTAVIHIRRARRFLNPLVRYFTVKSST